MARRLAGADLTVGNLESTLSRPAPPTQGGDSFAADPAVRAGLRAAGFDVLSLANNHTGDYGDAALVETVRRVRAAGFVPVGAGADLAAGQPAGVVERNGVRFGFVAFNAIGETPAAGTGRPGALRVRMQPRTGPLVPADLDRVTRSGGSTAGSTWCRAAALGHAVHPRPVPTSAGGRALIAAGADLVVGGHPHWVQGQCCVGDALIVHSLGNFVFDMDFCSQTQEGLCSS